MSKGPTLIDDMINSISSAKDATTIELKTSSTPPQQAIDSVFSGLLEEKELTPSQLEVIKALAPYATRNGH